MSAFEAFWPIYLALRALEAERHVDVDPRFADGAIDEVGLVPVGVVQEGKVHLPGRGGRRGKVVLVERPEDRLGTDDEDVLITRNVGTCP